MKVSERTKWILTIGVLLVLIIGSGVFYYLQQQDNGRLEKDLAKARTTFITNSVLKEQHLSDIADANLDVFRLSLTYPASYESMEIQEALFGAAAEAQVTISTLSTSEPKAEKVGTVTYQVYSLNTAVQGTPENLTRFIGVLGYWLPTANLEAVGLSAPVQGEATLSLTLKVYTLGA